MKKTFFSIFILLFLILVTVIFFLSTKGYETDKFNIVISNKIENFNKDLKVNLDKIRIKINVQDLSLFLSTKKPAVEYQNIQVPINEFKIFVDFFSLFTNQVKIEKINVKVDEIEIKDLKQMILKTKPSNFKSFIIKNFQNGSVEGDLSLDYLKENKFDYQLKGVLNNAEINVFKNKFKNINLNFIADNKNIFFNGISFNYKEIFIDNGSLNIDMDKSYFIDGTLASKIDLNRDQIKNLSNDLSNLKITSEIKDFNLKASVIKKFKVELDKTLKVNNYQFDIKSDILNSSLVFKKPKKIFFLENELDKISFGKGIINIDKTFGSPLNIFSEGIYKINDVSSFEKYKVKNSFYKSKKEFEFNIDLKENFLIDIINYNKEKDKTANIQLNFILKQNEIQLRKIQFKEDKNLISINNLILDQNNKFKKLDLIRVKTFQNDEENNDFTIKISKKISISGKKFDATNLIKNLSEDKNKDNTFGKVSKDINISFKKILTKKLNVPLNDFNLIGKIEKGKFVKISSKSEFSKSQFLDISLAYNKKEKKKVLEIYSDLPKFLLSDLKFFNGIEGGQLLFTSIYDDTQGYSNLQLKNFKVMNAPAFAKLLALADLRGLEILLSGKGLEFHSLEIKLKEDKKLRLIEEIYAVGPSLTILMEGYVEKDTGLTSLRGTMVPAKEINKLISKIPVLGEILIGKEVGEGVFGVSFKMKGPPGKIKTTVNPIKTLTPRFITRALEKRKKDKND